MRKPLINRQNLTGRLRWFFLLYVLLLVPMGTWADYFDIAIQYGTEESNFHSVLVTGNPNDIEGNPTDILGDGTMSYDQENNVLTLNGVDLTCSYESYAFINHNGFMDAEQVVTVRLVGSNTVTLGNNSYFFEGKQITFTAADNDASLKIETQDGREIGIFSDRATPTYNDNLGFFSNTSEIKYAESYALWVGGVQVTEANADDVFGDGTVSYGNVDNFFYLGNAEINGDIVYNGDDTAFYILLTGANTVNRITYTGQQEVTLHVMKANEEPGSRSLTVTGNGTDAAISGFTNMPLVTDNYDSGEKLYWKPTVTNDVMTSLLVTTDVFGGGDGTEDNPYVISTPLELALFAQRYNQRVAEEVKLDCYVELGAVIDCTNLADFEPIGTSDYPFIGTFDGKSTNNLYIEKLNCSVGSTETCNGLFGYIDGGTVQDLKLSNCSFSEGDENGVIVGCMSSGTIQNCTVTGCTVSTSNTQSQTAGGIAGKMYGGTIDNCKVQNSTISGTTDYEYGGGSTCAGGIAGDLNYNESDITISNCEVSNSTITASNPSPDGMGAGGIYGGCEGSGEVTITISGNKVKGTTQIVSIDGCEECETTDYSKYNGAIGCAYDENIFTLSNNTYEYTVTTSMKKGDADAVVRDGYTMRGTGTENHDVIGFYDVPDNDGAVLYTKKLMIGHEHIEEGYGPAEWHKAFSTDGGVFHLIPGLETTVTLQPANYHTITAATLSYGATPTVDNLNGVVEDGVYSYTFTMPDNDATLTPTIEIPGYLGLTIAGTPVTETNASNVMGDEYASVSYSDGTLTLKGALIVPGSEDVIIIDEDVEALTVHLVGYNQIGAYGHYAFSLSGNTALTFTTSDKMPGSLVSNGNVFIEEQQPSVTYQNGLALDADNTEIKDETVAMAVTGLTGALSYVNSDNDGTAYMYSNPFPFEATKADMNYGDAVVVSTPENTTTTELWTSNIQSANVLKYTLQFDWGTCTNKNVTVQVVGYNQNEQTYAMEADGKTYSDAVALSTADADGIIEIPLTKDVTSSELRLRFSSDAAFSFVALSVGIAILPNAPYFYTNNEESGTTMGFEYGEGVVHYAIDYASDDLEDVEEATWVMEDDAIPLDGPCTVTAFVVNYGLSSATVKGKYFDSNPSPFRLIWGAAPVDLVLAPAIEESDGITINGIEASVTYNTETGKISSEAMGSLSGPCSMSETEGKTVILNNYFWMNFEVVPPAPTVSLEAGSYLATHEPITLTGTGQDGTQMMYQWDDGNAEEYTEEIPFQAGTLMAWEIYSDGNTVVNGDTTTVVYTLATDLDITYAESQSWATYYATENLTVPEGLTAYVVSSVDAANGTVTTEQVDYIPMNQAVLLKRSEGAPLTGFAAAPYTGEESTATNLLQGTAEGISVGSITTSTVYVLYNDGFTRATKGSIPGHRGYLLLSAAVNPPNSRLFIVEGNATGISEMRNENERMNNAVYNLQGRKVRDAQPNSQSSALNSQLKMGIYIINGKKTIIK